MSFTDEQQAIILRSKSPKSFAVKAYAGTGKTFTGSEIAKANPSRRFTCIVFNKKAAEENRKRFPENTDVRTAHSLAFGSQGKYFAKRLVTSMHALSLAYWPLFEHTWVRIDGTMETSNMGYLATMEGLNAFLASADPQPALKHIPSGGPFNDEHVLNALRTIWSAMSDKNGTMPATHDTYLKVWQLSNPQLRCDEVIFDECQDASDAMLDIVMKSGKPVIYLGDPYQSIYAFRGAVNAFESLAGLDMLPLSASWRFGPQIAAEATKILSSLGESVPLRGNGPESKVTTDRCEPIDAIIARSTTGLVTEAIAAAQSQTPYHLVGGTEQIFTWLRGAHELHAYDRTRSQAFSTFKSWSQCVEVSETALGAAYKPYVRLIDEHGTNLPELMNSMEYYHTDVTAARLTLSSAHRFKGQEMDHVRIADDFAPFAEVDFDRDGNTSLDLKEEEANLAYVALTRAKVTLDLSLYHKTLSTSLQAIQTHNNCVADRANDL